jgi:transposase
MIKTFDFKTVIYHNDTTCVLMFGDAANHRFHRGIAFTLGHCKQYYKNLKYQAWSLSISSDIVLPLFQQTYSGNTIDVTTYENKWHNLFAFSENL